LPEDDRKLPPELTETLVPHQRRALEHPIRRQLLRCLNRTHEAQTLADLGECVPDVGISTISYHILVLQQCGFVSVSPELPRPGRVGHSFSSNIADDRVVTVALDATLQLDMPES
jgi:DNA-binding transcriptional ArsR family regulator